jgi:hypothetical protein
VLFIVCCCIAIAMLSISICPPAAAAAVSVVNRIKSNWNKFIQPYCTLGNFDEQVKLAVESDKTLMVRWIASEG